MAFTIDLSDKVVIVTGVSSGIGAGIAQMYAKAGAQLAGCALESPEHESIRQFRQTVLAESGHEPMYVQADVTRLDDLEAFVVSTVERYGRIDVLASNAGANVFKGAETCSQAEWNHNLNLNLESHWQLARLSKPHLEKNGNGVIVINSSCHAFSSLPGCFPYNVAKMGLRTLVQSLTVEWGPAIRTVGVAPGFIDTQLTRTHFGSFPDPMAERLRTESRFPVKRLGTPDDIGAWFVFLSSHYASFAAGQTFLVDGGKAAVMMDA